MSVTVYGVCTEHSTTSQSLLVFRSQLETHRVTAGVYLVI